MYVLDKKKRWKLSVRQQLTGEWKKKMLSNFFYESKIDCCIEDLIWLPVCDIRLCLIRLLFRRVLSTAFREFQTTVDIHSYNKLGIDQHPPISTTKCLFDVFTLIKHFVFTHIRSLEKKILYYYKYGKTAFVVPLRP